MIENEFKIMLSSEQYEKLLALYEFRTVEQINHYYDTADLQMSERHITVRVRELEGDFFLQMKLPAASEFSRVELSEKLEALPEVICGEALEALAGGSFPDVVRLGELVTVRSICKFDGGEIDLDRSMYFNKTDYELEIEFTDEAAARQMLSEITERLGIRSDTEVCTGKIRRFLEEYRKK